MTTWRCLAMALWAAVAARGGGPLVSVTVEPQADGRDVMLVFAHPFREGDAKDTVHVCVRGEQIPAQVTVKRRYPDGSAKHAILAVPLERVRRGQARTLEIRPGAGKQADAEAVTGLPQAFAAEVVFTFPDGLERRANAANFLARATAGQHAFRARQWLFGPHVTEYQLQGPPLGADGTPDPDLLVLFGLRVFRGGRSVRVEVVVENPWVDSPGNIPYDVQIVLGGKQAFAQHDVGRWEHRMPYWLKGEDRSLGHFARSRWRRVFWWGEAPPELHVRYDLAYLVSTGLLPPYDTSLRVSQHAIEKTLRRWEATPRGILENGLITSYFPMTGGRWDLGPYPTWTTRCLLTQDRGLRRVCLGTGDLAGSFPVHIRDRRMGGLLSLDDRPGFSLNSRGTKERIAPRRAPDRPYVRPAASPYAVDCAHQPSLAFVPYVLTGEHYYLEEMGFWANWCMLVQNAWYRDMGKGLLHPDQVRGEAWALRQLVDAAKIAPDQCPEGAYFDARVKSNLAWYGGFVAGPKATPLGTYTAGATDAYVRGRPQPERQKWLTLAPWQQNFLAWSLDHAVRAGYAGAARPRDYLIGCQVGMLTHPDDFEPTHATSYFLVVGERVSGQVRYYTTWKELFDKTFRVVEPKAKPPLLKQDYGSSYAYIARAVLLLGLEAGVPRSDDALAILEQRLPKRAQVLADDPTWAFGR